jgi:glycosyltransferase involved in cell wall biosynthesis
VSASPPLAIGLPVHNGERFLAEALESLLAQTYESFELVVSDNASTDGTEAICRDYAARDERMRYVRREENRGAAWNFNAVVRETSGQYFRWAAADDVSAPTCVERCVAALEDSPRAVLAYPRCALIDEHGAVMEELSGFDLRQEEPYKRLAALVRQVGWGNAAFGVVRRDALMRTRLLGSFPSADFVLFAELAMLGEIHELPEVLFFRRDHPGRSRRANTKASDVAEWFAPGSGRGRVREVTRLFLEYLRAFARSPVGSADRARCLAAFSKTWLFYNGAALVEEWTGYRYPGGSGLFRSRQAR